MVYQKQSVVVLAPAKLNLSLDVAGLLPNGYHDLDMVMQTIDLYERVTLRRSADLTLRLPGSFSQSFSLRPVRCFPRCQELRPLLGQAGRFARSTAPAAARDSSRP